jgi:hypothetical protein
MLQLIVILAIAFIVVPLIDLSTSERSRIIAKAVTYILTLLWLVGLLIVNKGAF